MPSLWPFSRRCSSGSSDAFCFAEAGESSNRNPRPILIHQLFSKGTVTSKCGKHRLANYHHNLMSRPYLILQRCRHHRQWFFTLQYRPIRRSRRVLGRRKRSADGQAHHIGNLDDEYANSSTRVNEIPCVANRSAQAKVRSS